jgi:hypothetical protein
VLFIVSDIGVRMKLVGVRRFPARIFSELGTGEKPN